MLNNMSDLLIKIIADWMIMAVIALGGVGFLILTKGNRYQAMARAVFAGLVALLTAKLASLFYQGERPFVLLGEEPKAVFLNNPGFPSDHTLLVFVITFVVWSTTKNVPLTLVLLIMSSLVASGRVIALVHTPIDVIGGIVCAMFATLLVYGKKLYSFK